MNLAYTDSFSVTTTEVLIKKGETPGSGVIPDNIAVRSITVVPDSSAGTFPVYHIRGIHSSSDWSKIDAATPVYAIDGIDDISNIYFYVKADSGTITLNLHVKGQIS